MIFHLATMNGWQAIVLSLVLAIAIVVFINLLYKVIFCHGKVVEQSGGLFIEYDHYRLWSWLKFPDHFVEFFLYHLRLKTAQKHLWFALTDSFQMACRRCIWTMKYRPLHATPEQVLEYYCRVKWVGEPPPSAKF